ncbi:MAG: radical SAM protein [Armatimonadetes bacterium]|nr:radical SAM protein [Armatimonadota bacterium]
MQTVFDLPMAQTISAPESLGGTEIAMRRVKRILNPAKGMVEAYDFTLNPYIGCQFGCSYCYAAFFVAEPAKADDWGNWVEIKENAVELLANEHSVRGSKVYLGSVTDPYQPIEMETGLTRSLLEVIVKMNPQPRLVIQTRSPLVTRDIDLLQKFDHVRVNLSITTDNEQIRKEFEPKCASIARRIEAAHKLKRSGIAVGVCISPMLPIADPERFAYWLRDINADCYSTCTFHKGSRSFASGTRPQGAKLAKKWDWNSLEYVEAVVKMKRILPELDTKGKAFDPV